MGACFEGKGDAELNAVVRQVVEVFVQHGVSHCEAKKVLESVDALLGEQKLTPELLRIFQ